MDDEIQDCPGSLESEKIKNNLDTSGLEVIEMEDDSTYFSGELIFLSQFSSKVPWILNCKTQYLDRGIWINAPMQFSFLNACPKFSEKDEIWYNLTKNFNEAGCPPKAGVSFLIKSCRAFGLLNFTTFI